LESTVTSLSEPLLGPYVYRAPGNSTNGTGYVAFFEADQSLNKTLAKISQMRNLSWWHEEKHLSTSVEVMFFN
jgi:hypothetical protein